MLINSLYVIVCVIVLFEYVLSYTPGYLFGKFSALSFCVTLPSSLRKRPFSFLKPIISVRRQAYHETCFSFHGTAPQGKTKLFFDLCRGEGWDEGGKTRDPGNKADDG